MFLKKTKNKLIDIDHISILACKTRLAYLIMPFATFYVIIILRLFDLTVMSDDKLAHHITTSVQYKRPEILDRNNIVLATNLYTASIYANPSKITDIEKTAKEISKIFHDLNYDDLLTLLTSKKSFVWLKRHIIPKQQMELKSLGLPGINLLYDEKRVYPHGNLFAHILGYVDTDGNGIAGIESYINGSLQNNKSITLSVDLRIQNVIRKELINGIEKYKALGGVAIVLDSRNGEIIGMTSLPDFDPNIYTKATDNQKFNRASLGVYEMGSIFKLFTIAGAIDSGKVKSSDIYDISGPITIGKYQIKDFHEAQNPNVTVQEIFAKSSNIGMAKIAIKMGQNTQIEYLKRMNLFSNLTLEIPEKSSPILQKKWYDTTLVTVSYGYGVAVTPLHVAQAAAALVNGGIMHPATLIHNHNVGTRIIKETTSSEIKKLLRIAVRRGTGKRAEAAGYMVGGKTGSAEKAISGQYQKNANLSSFIGIFPISKPKYVVLVLIDEPHNDNRDTGGVVAAPIVKNIINRIAPILNVAPEKQL